MKSKKGGLFDENLIGLIIAVAVVFVLLALLFNLFAPSFDKAGKTAESYFDSLERAIEVADSEGVGDFFMINNEGDDLEFYLAYFGGVASFGDGGKDFVRSKQGENIICVCYRKRVGDVICKYCEDLKLPVSYISEIKEADGKSPQLITSKISEWVIREGEGIKVTKREGYYEFSVE